MSATATKTDCIAYDYRATGEVQCKNPKGLVFFLRADPPKASAWKTVEATREVEVKRHVEAQTVGEATRSVAHAPESGAAPGTFTSVAATHEVEVRRAPEPVAAPAPARSTGPLTNAPAPGGQPAKGWFSKLLGK